MSWWLLRHQSELAADEACGFHLQHTTASHYLQVIASCHQVLDLHSDHIFRHFLMVFTPTSLNKRKGGLCGGCLCSAISNLSIPNALQQRTPKEINILQPPEKTILTLVRLQTLKIITRSDWNLLFSFVLKRLIMVHNVLLSVLSVIERIHFKYQLHLPYVYAVHTTISWEAISLKTESNNSHFHSKDLVSIEKVTIEANTLWRTSTVFSWLIKNFTI